MRGMQNFRRLWIGQTVSQLGSGLTRFGLGVWVYLETGSVLALGTMLVFGMLPVAIGSIIAGPIVDRLNRKRVLIVSDIVAGASSAGLASIYFLGQLEFWHVYIALAINATASAFQLPAYHSSIPLIAPREHLSKTSGLIELSRSLESVLSPLLGGVVLGVVGIGGLFAIDLLSLIFAIACLAFTTIPQTRPDSQVASQPSSFIGSIAEGLRFLRQDKSLAQLMLFLTTVTFFLGFSQALYVPLVESFTAPVYVGAIVAAIGMGTIAGSSLLTVWGGPRRKVASILVGTAGFGVGVATAGIYPSLVFTSLGFFIMGAASAFSVGLNRAIYQERTPNKLLGRVFSVRVTLSVSAQALGMLLASPIVNLFNEVLEGLLSWGKMGAIWVGQEPMGIGVAFVAAGITIVGLSVASFGNSTLLNLDNDLDPIPLSKSEELDGSTA